MLTRRNLLGLIPSVPFLGKTASGARSYNPLEIATDMILDMCRDRDGQFDPKCLDSSIFRQIMDKKGGTFVFTRASLESFFNETGISPIANRSSTDLQPDKKLLSLPIPFTGYLQTKPVFARRGANFLNGLVHRSIQEGPAIVAFRNYDETYRDVIGYDFCEYGHVPFMEEPVSGFYNPPHVISFSYKFPQKPTDPIPGPNLLNRVSTYGNHMDHMQASFRLGGNLLFRFDLDTLEFKEIIRANAVDVVDNEQGREIAEKVLKDLRLVRDKIESLRQARA